MDALKKDADSSVLGRALPVIALVLVALVFIPSINFDFVHWDDDTHVYENSVVTTSESVTLSDLIWNEEIPYPIPVTFLTYRLEFVAFGLEPAAFHTTNVILHLLACFLVFLIARKLGIGALGATGALLLFGLHPVVAEPVSWVTGRKDLLAAVFSLWAVLVFLDAPWNLRSRKTWFVLLLFCCAVLSKPVALFLPALFMIWHYLFHVKKLRTSFLVGIPTSLLCVPIAIQTVLGESEKETLVQFTSIFRYLREIWYAFGYHLGLLSFVHEPCVKHIPTTMPPPFQWEVDLLPIVWLVIIGAVVWRAEASKRRIIYAGVVFAILSYLPSSNIIPFTRYLADSFVYLPLVGFAWIIGLGIDRLDTLLSRYRLGRICAAGILLIAFSALIPVTMAFSSDWSNSIALWKSGYDKYPDSPRVCRSLGNAYNEADRADLALAQYQLCATQTGSDIFDKNIAITLYRLGRFEEATEAFKKFAATHPNDPVTQKYLKLIKQRSSEL